MFARLDSAVVTQGVLLAESQRKTVEHLEGGILEAAPVKPGDRVATGQVVAHLDATQTEAQLAQLQADGLGLTFEIWRLEAEEAGALDPATAAGDARADGATLIAAQTTLFDARQRAHSGRSPPWGARSTSSAPSAGEPRPRPRRTSSSRAGPRSAPSRAGREGRDAAAEALRDRPDVALARRRPRRGRGLAAAAAEEIARAEADIETLGQQRLVEAGEQLVRGPPPLGALTASPAARRTCSNAAASAPRSPASSSTSPPSPPAPSSCPACR